MLVSAILRYHYKILKKLGSGGFGDTYLAEDLDLPGKPQCVVKHLNPQNPDPAVLQQAKSWFDREAEVLYRLGQLTDQIPKLFAHFEEDGEFYLVQEFIDGHDLSSELIPSQQLGEPEVVKLLQEILEVLVVVHKNNVIHRDLKPQNIMRSRDGKIVLIDFGAVKEIHSITLNQGQISSTIPIGSPGYIPNEQSIGKPRLCSDVYAVGMLGIQALTGIYPQQLPQNHINGEVIWRNWANNVSNDLTDVLNKMVRYKLNERYQNAAEALQALQLLKSPTPTGQLPHLSLKSPSTLPSPPQPSPSKHWTRRRVIKAVGFAGTGLAIAVFGKEIWQTISDTNSAEQKLNFSSHQSGVSLKSFQFQTVTVDTRGRIISRRNLQAKYFVEDLGNGVILEMVQIPGGTFKMGSPSGEKGRLNRESPQHTITIKHFFMGKYEVTQAQYQVIMGQHSSGFTGKKRPVEKVSWNDAVEFCQRLSQKTGRNYRLPSEAEWEYACRAGTTTPFYFGETITTDLVNYNGNYLYASAPKGNNRRLTIDVGTFPPNAFGLYDMHGNVWEWCQDTWHDNYNGAPKDGSAWIDNSHRDRVLRGCSWYYNPQECRSAFRSHYNPAHGNSCYGFRVVCGSVPRTLLFSER